MTSRSIMSICAVALLTASACQRASNDSLQGRLYFGAGGYLGEFDLADGESAVVVGVGQANIRQVHELYGSRVLLVMDVLENQREVQKVSWIDVKTLQLTALFSGVAASYLPAVETYVYDSGSRLIATSTNINFKTDKVILNHSLNAVSSLIPVSGDAFVFSLKEKDRDAIYLYDASTAELLELAALSTQCRLDGAVWITEERLLACPDATGEVAYALVDLDGKMHGALSLIGDGEFRAVEYLSGQGVLILTERHRGLFDGKSSSAVWAYNLKRNEMRKLSENQHLGSTTAWLDH